MKLSAETIYRIGRISQNLQVANIYAGVTLTANIVTMSDGRLLSAAFAVVSNYAAAPAREILIFAAAMIRHHRAAQARYSVAIRRSA
jgi:hypothetical protein